MSAVNRSASSVGESLAPAPRTLVLGGGACGRRLAAAVAAADLEVLLCEPEPCSAPPAPCAGLRWLPGRRLVRCHGAAGAFHAVLHSSNGSEEALVGSIVLALEPLWATNGAALGLSPGGSVAPLAEQSPPAAGSRVLFALGLDHEGTPAETGAAMSLALAWQQAGIRCTLLTRNLKVAAAGLERRFQECRQAGVLFCKLDPDQVPAVTSLPDGRLLWSFHDVVTRERLRLTADRTLLDRVARPAADLSALAEILRLPVGEDGFLGSGNLHRLVTLTPRRGVLAIGPARGVFDPEGQALDLSSAEVALRGLHGGRLAPPAPRGATIDQGRCVRCLTCYRLCPYRAISLNGRVAVAPEACEGCGICAAECPNVAIRIAGLDRPGWRARVQPAAGAAPPRLVALLCSRSAAQARAAALADGLADPEGLEAIAVPCAGGVSLEHLLLLFGQGAHGVLVIGCHRGNCHSEIGTDLGRGRVEMLARSLEGLGVAAERLQFATLAANMASGYHRLITTWAEGMAPGKRPDERGEQ